MLWYFVTLWHATNIYLHKTCARNTLHYATILGYPEMYAAWKNGMIVHAFHNCPAVTAYYTAKLHSTETHCAVICEKMDCNFWWNTENDYHRQQCPYKGTVVIQRHHKLEVSAEDTHNDLWESVFLLSTYWWLCKWLNSSNKWNMRACVCNSFTDKAATLRKKPWLGLIKWI